MKTLVLSTTGHPEANLESARYFIQNKSNIEKITILSSEWLCCTNLAWKAYSAI